MNEPVHRHHCIVRLTHWCAFALIFGMITYTSPKSNLWRAKTPLPGGWAFLTYDSMNMPDALSDQPVIDRPGGEEAGR